MIPRYHSLIVLEAGLEQCAVGLVTKYRQEKQTHSQLEHDSPTGVKVYGFMGTVYNHKGEGNSGSLNAKQSLTFSFSHGRGSIGFPNSSIDLKFFMMKSTLAIGYVSLHLLQLCTAAAWWTPAKRITWQTSLEGKLQDLKAPGIEVFDIPLQTGEDEATRKAFIDQLHNTYNKKVICYFNAGAYEPALEDATKFNQLIPGPDIGKKMEKFPAENWLNLTSDNVKSIMKERILTAKRIGCDGVDPDNVDGYCTGDDVADDPECATKDRTGFSQSVADTNVFMTFLAGVAHSSSDSTGRAIAIGLKNSYAVANNQSMVDLLDWSVNEHKKPVFHIEYKDSFEAVGGSLDMACHGNSSAPDKTNVPDFSTLYKLTETSLTEGGSFCPTPSKKRMGKTTRSAGRRNINLGLPVKRDFSEVV
ncbi:hypothetical protein G7Y89_g11904 [Cudoniella acicularis]|uniref:alpha-galactosidase n=1 Tax=Cudoniella acicularis TaxID=354080 RepID=A0A8H4RB40_9HELO|nr:hypothetical protein G7Y89_g11904 [Cudoniella acicularis]